MIDIRQDRNSPLVTIDAKRDGSHSGTPGLNWRLGVSNESIC